MNKKYWISFRIVFLFVFAFLFQDINAQCPGFIGVSSTGDFCVGNPITFINTSSGVVDSYSWNFADGTPEVMQGATPQNISHTFTSAGSYTIVLSRICSGDTQTVDFMVEIVDLPEKPLITIDQNNICAQIEASFGVSNQDNSINYSWTFGDPRSELVKSDACINCSGSLGANSATGTNVNHSFTATGSDHDYSVSVVAISPEGCATSSDAFIVNTLATTDVLIADTDPNFASAGIFKRCAVIIGDAEPFTFTFTNNSVIDEPTTTFDWNWGDGSPNTTDGIGATVEHEYTVIGLTGLTMTATNPMNGCVGTGRVDIINEQSPSSVLSIAPEDIDICDGESITVDNNSENATNFLWEWGENSGNTTETSNLDPVDHTFDLVLGEACVMPNARGIPTVVSLTAFNSCFEHRSTTELFVKPKVIPIMTPDPGWTVCPESGNVIEFTVNSCPDRQTPGFLTEFRVEILDPNDPIDIIIKPADNNVFTHTFTTPGDYIVRTTASPIGGAGCGQLVIEDIVHVTETAVAMFSNTENAVLSEECSVLNLPDMTPSLDCLPFSLGLINESTNLVQGVDFVKWSVDQIGATFGSGDTVSNAYDENITFQEAGSYRINLAVANECNVTISEACAIVNVRDTPGVDNSIISGLESAGFQIVGGTIGSLLDTLKYSKCDITTLDSLHLIGLDPTTETYLWHLDTVSTANGVLPIYPTPSDSLPGTVTIDVGTYVLQTDLSNECGDTTTAPVLVSVVKAEPTDAGGVLPVATECDDASFAGKAGFMKEIVECSGDVFNIGLNTSTENVTYAWSTPEDDFDFDSDTTANTTATIFNTDSAGNNVCHLAYIEIDNGSCVTIDSVLLVVKATAYAGPDVLICNSTDTYTLEGFTPSEGNNLWSILNGSDNSVTNAGVYSPDSISVDTLVFDLNTGSVTGCKTTDTLIITVVEPVPADAGLIDSVCVSDSSYVLQSGISTPFSVIHGSAWTGLGTVDGTDSIAISSLTTAEHNVFHEYVYAYGLGNCASTDTTHVKFFGAPVISPPISPANNMCENESALFIEGYSASTNGVSTFDSTYGVWTGAGITPQGNHYLFDPILAGASDVAVNLTFTYTDSATANCVSVYEHSVRVLPLPMVDVDIPNLYCVDQSLEIINNSTIDFGTIDSSFWYFTPVDSIFEKFDSITNFTFTQAGDYQVVYRINPNDGCDTTVYFDIKIIELPKADFTLTPDTSSNCGPRTVVIADNNSSGLDSLYYWSFGLDTNVVESYLANDTTLIYEAGYTTDTTYFISLVVANPCATDTMVQMIDVLPSPNVSFGTNVSEGCSPLEVEFNNNSLGLIQGEETFYTFLFSDGSPDFGPVTHTIVNDQREESFPNPMAFTYEGETDTTYTITLIAQNSCGTDTGYFDVKVLPVDVKAFFNQSSSDGCSPLIIDFTDLSSNASFVSWDFGDNTSEVGRSTNHTFFNDTEVEQEFEIQQMVSNACSEDTVSQKITVFPSPKAEFTIDNTVICKNDSRDLINNSQDISSSQWLFDNPADTVVNIDSDINYRFDSSGISNVRLVVMTVSHGCTDTLRRTLEIDALPQILLSSDTVKGCEPYTYSANLDSIQEGYDYLWTDGEGDSLSINHILDHTFIGEGMYSIKLQTTTENGCVNTDSVMFDLLPQPDVAFNITASLDSCSYPKTYIMANKSSSDLSQFYWFVGEDSLSHRNNAEYEFTRDTVVEVTLRGVNKYDCPNELTKEIKTEKLPEANFIGVNRIGCEPVVTDFTNTSTDAVSYQWSFGDDAMSDLVETNHLYSDGLYDVTLVATALDGCRDTLVREEYVFAQNRPVADFEYTTDQNAENGTIDFTSTSEGASFFTWFFGGENENTESEESEFRYSFYGEEEVTLAVRSENDCRDTITKIINVPFFGGLFVPNAFVPNISDPEIGTFKPVGFGLEEYHCQVFDTWGNLIWESTLINDDLGPAEGWDGTYKGEPLPENSYAWKIEATFIGGFIWEGMKDKEDTRKRKAGTITLIR